MSYLSDLCKHVLDFVYKGGREAKVSPTYNVSRTYIYNWLVAADPLSCKEPGPRGPHRLDFDALKQHVADFPIIHRWNGLHTSEFPRTVPGPHLENLTFFSVLHNIFRKFCNLLLTFSV